MYKNKKVDPNRSKSAKRAKRKGSKAQREVARILSLWFFNNTDSFHSTPASGGLRWNKNVAGTRGDIVPSEEIRDSWNFSVEVKNQEASQFDLLSLLTGTGPIIKEWWKQAYQDAKIVGKDPLLIFTRNNQPYFIMFDKEILNEEDGLIIHSPKRSFVFYLKETSQHLIISTLGDLLWMNDQNYTFDLEEKDQKLLDKNIYKVVERYEDYSIS